MIYLLELVVLGNGRRGEMEMNMNTTNGVKSPALPPVRRKCSQNEMEGKKKDKMKGRGKKEKEAVG